MNTQHIISIVYVIFLIFLLIKLYNSWSTENFATPSDTTAPPSDTTEPPPFTMPSLDNVEIFYYEVVINALVNAYSKGYNDGYNDGFIQQLEQSTATTAPRLMNYELPPAIEPVIANFKTFDSEQLYNLGFNSYTTGYNNGYNDGYMKQLEQSSATTAPPLATTVPPFATTAPTPTATIPVPANADIMSYMQQFEPAMSDIPTQSKLFHSLLDVNQKHFEGVGNIYLPYMYVN